MYEYDFQKDKDFFKKSPTFNEVLETVKNDKYVSKEEPKLIETSVKLWAESVLKHNLSTHMSIDPIQLISEENSNDVKKTFGKIMGKEKHSRTDADYQDLRKQALIQNMIMLHAYHQTETSDLFTNLKSEFKAYKEPAVTKKIKP
jgi:hypothetical protein